MIDYSGSDNDDHIPTTSTTKGASNKPADSGKEFLKAARQKRKRHRNNEQMSDLEGESDVDEEFKTGFDQAAKKYGVKRKKKYMFNEVGIPIEPFNLENDIKGGVLSNEGIFKMEREKRQLEQEDDELKDAWFDSVKQIQDQMKYDECLNKQNSSSNESQSEEEGEG